MREVEHCERCRAVLSATNHALNETHYGCETCRGKRPELSKTLGQEDDAHLFSKAQSG